MASHLIVACRECGAAVGEGCKYVGERKRGEPAPGGHPIRRAMADHRRASDATAEAIAQWMEDGGPVGRSYAAAIRAGLWRKEQDRG
jgi:hypothetical protein